MGDQIVGPKWYKVAKYPKCQKCRKGSKLHKRSQSIQTRNAQNSPRVSRVVRSVLTLRYLKPSVIRDDISGSRKLISFCQNVQGKNGFRLFFFTCTTLLHKMPPNLDPFSSVFTFQGIVLGVICFWNAKDDQEHQKHHNQTKNVQNIHLYAKKEYLLGVQVL